MLKDGFSLIEVIVASAILGLITTSLVGLYVSARSLDRNSTERFDNHQSIANTLEQVRQIRDSDFEDLVDGSYSVVDQGGVLQLVSAIEGEPVVTISSLSDDAKLITTEYGENVTARVATVLTNWQKDVIYSNLAVDVTNVEVLDDNKREVVNFKVTNQGGVTATINRISLVWTKQHRKRKFVEIEQDQSPIWLSSNGIDSGEDANLTAVISPGEATVFDFEFTRNMQNRDFIVELETSTGEVITSEFST